MYAREQKLPLGEQSCFLFRPRQTGKTTLLALLADAKPRLRSFREDHPGGRLVCVGEIDRPFKLGNIECRPWRRGCPPATPNHPGLSTEAPWAKPPRRNVDSLPTDSAEDAFFTHGPTSPWWPARRHPSGAVPRAIRSTPARRPAPDRRRHSSPVGAFARGHVGRCARRAPIATDRRTR